MKKIMFNDKYRLTEAVLQGTKTMTRRDCNLTLTDRSTMDPVEIQDIYYRDGCWYLKCENKEYLLPKEYYPKYKLNEIVAISQSYSECTCDIPEQCISKYKDGKMVGYSAGWSNKMFVKAAYMPHNLKIINIKAERLQDISDEDCIKEGIEISKDNRIGYKDYYCFPGSEKEKHKIGWRRCYHSPREVFSELIDKISGEGSWTRNKWHWVLEFELIK